MKQGTIRMGAEWCIVRRGHAMGNSLVLALSRCAPDPTAGISTPLCAYTNDYFGFARAESHAPLLVASAAYTAYVVWRVDFGAYVKTARLLTCALVQCAAWLALAALELAVVWGGVDAATGASHVAARVQWSPGFALLGAPAALWTGLALALFSDVTLGVRPVLRLFALGGDDVAGVAASAAARLGGGLVAALAPAAAVAALASVVDACLPAGAAWVIGVVATLLVGTLYAATGGDEAAHDAAAASLPLAIVWALSAYRYTWPYATLLVASAYAGLALLSSSLWPWAAQRRAATVSRYGRLARR